MKCESCKIGELQEHDHWWRYKTPYNSRLCNERAVFGTIFKCDNEKCSAFFYNDEECEELKEGHPC